MIVIEKISQELLETAPDAIVIVNEDGRIVLVNAQAEALFGYVREELIGQPLEALVPERFRDRHRQHRQEYFRNPRFRPTRSIIETHGGRLWATPNPDQGATFHFTLPSAGQGKH